MDRFYAEVRRYAIGYGGQAVVLIVRRNGGSPRPSMRVEGMGENFSIAKGQDGEALVLHRMKPKSSEPRSLRISAMKRGDKAMPWIQVVFKGSTAWEIKWR